MARAKQTFHRTEEGFSATDLDLEMAPVIRKAFERKLKQLRIDQVHLESSFRDAPEMSIRDSITQQIKFLTYQHQQLTRWIQELDSLFDNV